jgi:hypothetical protein
MNDLHINKKGRKRNDKWQDRYLNAYAQEGNVQYASDVANVSRSTVYNHMRDDPAFSTQCDEAYARFCASIEREIKRRGFAGSDMLLMAMANRHMPAEYRQRQEIQQTITHDYVVEIGTPRVPAITNNADTIQDVTPQRVYETTGDVLE